MTFVDPSVRAVVESAGLEPWRVDEVITRALEEDIGADGDVTTNSVIPPTQVASADLVPRSSGVVAGLPVAAWAFDVVGEGRLRVEFGTVDGSSVTPGEVLATVTGPVRDILTAERTALNLLCHLSGVASLTRDWVDAVAGTGAQIRDTRKTMPGLRALEKYAVRCGGGVNHRMSLSDAALVKDNHVAAAGGVAQAFELVREAYPELSIEVEADTVEQAREAIEAGAQLVLLDNMSSASLREVVRIAAGFEGVKLEASGGLTLARAREVAETGVDYLSVGALTHSAPVLDIGLDLS
ncbi:nicotinate-nucleotide pyrophosphorylase [carboxylating] [Frankineae bacterium MT45]|nr:nicotinate-nucleotide pyrophosphorylase [carboxylating] [Frankineae bacterium MT45]